MASTDRIVSCQQDVGRQIARRKMPLWADTPGITYPPRLSMEQCSSQAAAEYKRAVVRSILQATANHSLEASLHSEAIAPATSFTDLTGGLAVDFSFLAPLFRTATYVERNADLCDLARHNLPLLLPHTLYNIVNDEAEHVLPTLPRQTLIFLDPARRDAAGRKVFLTADCQPDVVTLHDTLTGHADNVLIKLSPMLDLHDALRSLPTATQAHILEIGGEVKELLILLQPRDARPEISSIPIICADASKDRAAASKTSLEGTSEETPEVISEGCKGVPFVFTFEEEANAAVTYTATLDTYLYEPAPRIMKGGAFRTIAARYALKKLHPDTHLYTSDTLHTDFPGRILRVLAVSSLRETQRQMKRVTQANVVCRNFPAKPDALKQRLRLRDGGDTYLYATTLADNSHVIITATHT